MYTFHAPCFLKDGDLLARPTPAEVVRLTHITDDMVASAPGIEEVLPAFLAFIGGDAFVAHNASFDVGFLKYQCDRLGLRLPDSSADSLEVARRYWPGLSNYRLGTMAQDQMLWVQKITTS